MSVSPSPGPAQASAAACIVARWATAASSVGKTSRLCVGESSGPFERRSVGSRSSPRPTPATRTVRSSSPREVQPSSPSAGRVRPAGMVVGTGASGSAVVVALPDDVAEPDPVPDPVALGLVVVLPVAVPEAVGDDADGLGPGVVVVGSVPRVASQTTSATTTRSATSPAATSAVRRVARGSSPATSVVTTSVAPSWAGAAPSPAGVTGSGAVRSSVVGSSSWWLSPVLIRSSPSWARPPGRGPTVRRGPGRPRARDPARSAARLGEDAEPRGQLVERLAQVRDDLGVRPVDGGGVPRRSPGTTATADPIRITSVYVPPRPKSSRGRCPSGSVRSRPTATPCPHDPGRSSATVSSEPPLAGARGSPSAMSCVGGQASPPPRPRTRTPAGR